MKVIDIKNVPLEERPHVREGVFRTRKILAGEPNTPGNFSLQLVAMPESYYSPRHRHNFDQYRYQIEGEFDFSTDGRMGPGTIGYFPEGTFYGPQSSNSPSLTLVLQFGGASGSGYISEEQYQQTAGSLAKAGSFAKGVYTRLKEDGSKVNQDAFEAVWEEVNGRPLVYPGQRYSRPVFMQTDHFSWIPSSQHPGVSEKLLGVFSECGTRAAWYSLDAEARLQLPDNAIYFIEAGTGKVGNEIYDRYTTIYLKPGETATISAQTSTLLLQLGLPGFNQ